MPLASNNVLLGKPETLRGIITKDRDWPIATLRGDAAIHSLSERSGHFSEPRCQNRIYEYAPQAATDTIDCVATDQSGLSATSTRTVIISSPAVRHGVDNNAIILGSTEPTASEETLIRGKRFDDGMPDTEFEDEHTIARAVIRSIEKDNTVSIPYQQLGVNLEGLRELLSAFEKAFQIMRLQLGQEDDPQIIFETLNARGAPLQPSDLVRNFVFLRASRNGEVVDDLYKKYWQDFDEKIEPGLGSKGAKF